MVVSLSLASAVPALAQETRPAATQQEAAALTATITGVEGLVRVRNDAESPWQNATVGMVIGAGAEFRTGPKSAVRFVIPPDQTVTLDRLGTVKLMEAIRTADGVKTDLGMQYGRVRYDIEAAGVSHDSTIHSPGSALAVRGTKVSLYDQPPFKPEAISLTGRAEFRNARKRMVGFGGKSKAAIKSDDLSPAQNALASSLIQSSAIQYNDQQMRELTFLFTQQGAVFGNVAASNTRVTDAMLPSLLGGNLDFVLRWSAPGGADLNLVVNTPKGETFGNPPFVLSLFPNNPTVGKLLREELPQSSRSGGQIGLNHIGPEGIEIASFSGKPPTGTYVLAAYNFITDDKPTDTTGLPTVPFTIEAFLNGKRQPLLLNLEEAVAGTEKPRFGPVFRDEIALTELSGTALQIKQGSGSKTARPASDKPKRTTPAKTPVKPIVKPKVARPR